MEGINNNLEKNSIEESVNKLLGFFPLLEEIGLTPTYRLFENIDSAARNLEMGMDIPIVEDGLNGARISYDDIEGLELWFTNSFEDSNNETRLKIQEKWNNFFTK